VRSAYGHGFTTIAGAPYRFLETIGVYGLGQIVKHSGVEGPEGVFRVRSHHNYQRRTVASQEAQKIESGHIRQVDVEQNDIWVVTTNRMNCPST